jgi:WbqC-like protein family
MRVAEADKVILDIGEHFEKMTGRNRYAISGANNPILLSVPIESGRNHHAAMRDVQVFNKDNWQLRHWRTLISVYKRTPFFEHYESSLSALYEHRYEKLADLNLAALQWAMRQLKLDMDIEVRPEYVKDAGEMMDLRDDRVFTNALPRYYQIFEDRVGFLEDLSILDLLFSEGPASRGLLKL